MQQRDDVKYSLSDVLIYTRPRPWYYFLFKWGRMVAALLIPLAVIDLFYSLPPLTLIIFGPATPYLVGITGLGALIPLIMIVVKLVALSHRYGFDANKKLLKDTRPPVLYLRPFMNDDIKIPQIQIRERTYEEVLATALNSIGPVIAVGNPRNNKPIIGAARLYFEEGEWREKVEDLMTISQLIVLDAGFSSQFEWEFQTSLKQLAPDRLLISFLAWQALDKKTRSLNFVDFRRQAERIYKSQNTKLVRIIKSTSRKTDTRVALFLYFEEDGFARLIHNKCKQRFLFGTMSPAYIRTALHPVLE